MVREMKMLDDFFAVLKMLFEQTPVIVKAAIMAFFLRMLRVAYTNEEPRFLRRVLEGSICSILTIGIGYTLVAFAGLPEEVAYGVGSYIGWEGADRTAQKAKKKVRTIIGDSKDDSK